MEESMTEFKVT